MRQYTLWAEIQIILMIPNYVLVLTQNSWRAPSFNVLDCWIQTTRTFAFVWSVVQCDLKVVAFKSGRSIWSLAFILSSYGKIKCNLCYEMVIFKPLQWMAALT
jgi:hypothetical protein